MKTKLFLICVCLSATPIFAEPIVDEHELGEGATIIETQALTPKRSLVLWMVHPTKNPRDTPDEPYTCPEYTRGSYFRGPTRVSLVDLQTHKVVNTLKILSDSGEGTDEFDIPYSIRSNFYYHVEGAAKETEGKPTVVWLKDYNADGKAWEFALFEAQACMGLATTLIGYSERQDKVIQYEVRLVTNSNGKRSVTTGPWTDYLFSKKPTTPGSWKFAIDYRGRGGALAKYEIHYDKPAERFEGKLVETGGE